MLIELRVYDVVLVSDNGLDPAVFVLIVCGREIGRASCRERV